jgi:NAD(P)-dependent dehydrogenase (short-subunit alcohol dehydrogenase family)
MKSLEFTGKRAVITGGARGVGAAAARMLLERGASVCLWDRNADLLTEAQGRLAAIGPVNAQTVDVANADDVTASMEQAALLMDGIDILVTAAGIAGINAPVEQFPPDIWDQVMRVNLGGVFLCCRAVIPYMRRQDYGRIVTIASVAGKEGNPNASAYSASKAGVINLTRALGKELAKTGITVNSITPAVIATEMLKDVSEEQIGYMVSKIPMGRTGTPDEVAEMICFLASDRATFSTAAVFDMSGGRTTY